MPITLAEAKLNVQDDLQMGVIDEFRKSSFLFENLTLSLIHISEPTRP